MAKAFRWKDIVMAVRKSGPNPEANSRLRVIQNSKAANMQGQCETLKLLIKTRQTIKVLFEGYAPHGIAILVETATDNNNRTVKQKLFISM
jgi:transcriptional/translational regulatory protein YebC/TACO1